MDVLVTIKESDSCNASPTSFRKDVHSPLPSELTKEELLVKVEKSEKTIHMLEEGLVEKQRQLDLVMHKLVSLTTMLEDTSSLLKIAITERNMLQKLSVVSNYFSEESLCSKNDEDGDSLLSQGRLISHPRSVKEDIRALQTLAALEDPVVTSRRLQKQWAGVLATRVYETGHVDAAILIQSCARAWMARRLRHMLLQRSHIVRELLEKERSYVRTLKTLDKWYIKPLLTAALHQHEYSTPIIGVDDVDTIFASATDILDVHMDLMNRMQTRIDEWCYSTCIGDLFQDMASHIDLYYFYISNFGAAQACLSSCRKLEKFNKFLLDRRAHHSIKEDISDLIITPVQHIPRYLLLLQQLLKHTPQHHPDQKHLKAALEHIGRIAQLINERKRATSRVGEIEAQISGSFVDKLDNGERYIVLESTVNEHVDGASSKKNLCCLFLLNDCLICATPVSSSSNWWFHVRNQRNKDMAGYQGRWRISLSNVNISDFQVAATSLGQVPSVKHLVKSKLGLTEEDIVDSCDSDESTIATNSADGVLCQEDTGTVTNGVCSKNSSKQNNRNTLNMAQIVIWRSDGNSNSHTFEFATEAEKNVWISRINSLKTSAQDFAVVARYPSMRVRMNTNTTLNRKDSDKEKKNREQSKNETSISLPQTPLSIQDAQRLVTSLNREISIEVKILEGIENIRKLCATQPATSKQRVDVNRQYSTTQMKLTALRAELEDCNRIINNM